MSASQIDMRYRQIVVYVLTVILIGLLLFVRRPSNSSIVTAHVINMDKSTDRLNRIMSEAQAANIHLERWRAIDGAILRDERICETEKISKLVYRHAQNVNQPGVLGCFLSHRALLRHLQTLPCADTDAHLIFEDDAHIPADYWAQWDALCRADLPYDWDVVQLGVTHPNTTHYAGRIHVPSRRRGNVGLFAYVVRHGSLGKINAHLEYMYDPIDNMIADKYKEWRMYIVIPEIVKHNDGGQSTIRGPRKQ